LVAVPSHPLVDTNTAQDSHRRSEIKSRATAECRLGLAEDLDVVSCCLTELPQKSI
jgi:hypothetical protein